MGLEGLWRAERSVSVTRLLSLVISPILHHRASCIEHLHQLAGRSYTAGIQRQYLFVLSRVQNTDTYAEITHVMKD